jgi:DNA-binding MarR family transcriptional regulator
MQQLSTKPSSAAVALGQLVGATVELTRALSAELQAQHGLTLNEYEVLLLLSQAEEQSMRRVDLANEVRLSPSGITRMLDRLERAGLVGKGTCASDARVTYAVLTEAGTSKLEECAPDHMAAVDRLLGERFGSEELESLAGMLRRITERDADCAPG